MRALHRGIGRGKGKFAPPLVSLGGPAEDPRRAALSAVSEALEIMARRSEGLLHFVQNHRRLTRRLETKIEVLAVNRVFARLQRLLAAELATRHIELILSVEPETLEVTADAELLDQALINLMRKCHRCGS